MLPQGAGQGQSIETLYVDIAARADQLVREADAAVREVVSRLDQLEAKNKELEQSYSRLGEFMRRALEVGTGMILARIGGSVTNAVMNLGRSMVTANAQMQTFTQSFTVLTGSAEEAGEIIEWVKEQAKATPFDVPGLIQASQMLMTWGLDLKEWFEIVGDTAAAMNRPLSQVVNAIGTLATGQTGEAIRRFRDLGVNLRQYVSEGLEFDAQGSLITPLEEAIPIVKGILEKKYGGMMESQAKTWSGVMSNLGDAWQELVRTMGEPLFELLNEQLFNLYNWIAENEDALESLAENIGTALGGALSLMMDLVSGFATIADIIDNIIIRLTGMPDWLQRGIESGRQLAGIVAGGARGAIDVAGGMARGESLEEAARGAGDAWLETMLSVAGQTDNLGAKFDKLTEDQLAGINAVRDRYGDLWGEVTEGAEGTSEPLEKILEWALRGRAAEAVARTIQRLEDLGDVTEGSTQKFLDNNAAVIQVGRTYFEAQQAFLATKAESDRLAAALEEQRLKWEELWSIVGNVAAKFTERIEELVKAHEEKVKELTESTANEIAKLEAEADQAVQDAIVRTQDEITEAREAFAREQLKARERFNREWARLLREQNEEIIDAEWEYQYAKENLLIEGDEKALADLEVRYKHEKDVRGREHQEARGDLSERYAIEEQERQEQFEQTIRDLEARLAEEIKKIREETEEEVALKEKALEDRLADEDQALQDRLQRIGELLADEIGDNQVATETILALWQAMYGSQVAEALAAGLTVRQDLDATIQKALEALRLLREIDYYRLPPQRPTGPPGPYQEGGYTPPFTTNIITDPGEWIATADTTAALERAVGGPLTQRSVRDLIRKRMDVHMYGHGTPAGELRALREELVRALRKEGLDF